MDRDKKLRRSILLCSHFTRNLAYYRAGWKDGSLKRDDPFWKTLNSNFLDICVLEWCKLFGDHKDKYHWKNIMDYPSKFKQEMFQELNIKQADFDGIWASIKSLRDKFVAHLDNKEIMNIPQFDLALSLVIFFHKKAVKSLVNEKSLEGLPRDLKAFYDACYTEAEKKYKA